MNVICPHCKVPSTTTDWNTRTAEVVVGIADRSLVQDIASAGRDYYWWICPSCGEQVDNGDFTVDDLVVTHQPSGLTRTVAREDGMERDEYLANVGTAIVDIAVELGVHVENIIGATYIQHISGSPIDIHSTYYIVDHAICQG